MNQNKAPLACLYTSSGQRKYVTPAERARFIAAARTPRRGELRTLCLVLAHTGMRISEALALTAGSIQAEAGFIAVRTLKKRDVMVVREIPVPPDLLIALERRHAISRRQAHERLWKLSRSRAWQLIKALMQSCGIKDGPHATPKGLRHGYGVYAIRSGVPVNLVQRWLGHASMTTTAIYLQAVGDEEREIAARMWTTAPDDPKRPVSVPSTLDRWQGDVWSGLPSSLPNCPPFRSDHSGLGRMGTYRARPKVQRGSLPHFVCAAPPLKAFAPLRCAATAFDPSSFGRGLPVPMRPDVVSGPNGKLMETKMNDNTEQTKKRPSHIIYQVIGEEEKARWNRIGAAWTHKGGKGYYLRFDAYPVTGRIQMRENVEPDAREGDGGQP
jgi:hypothetical protein